MILAGGEEAYKVKDLLRSKDFPSFFAPSLPMSAKKMIPTTAFFLSLRNSSLPA